MTNPFDKRLALTTTLCLFAYFALQLLFFFKTVALPMGGRAPNITMWAIHALPLLMFLPGMLRGNYRSYTWLAFLILMYFLLSVEGVFAPEPSHYHSLSLVLMTVFLLSAMQVLFNGLRVLVDSLVMHLGQFYMEVTFQQHFLNKLRVHKMFLVLLLHLLGMKILIKMAKVTSLLKKYI